METEKAIRFLTDHQPMPDDNDINEQQAETYFQILKLFEKEKDERCIPLLINSVSENTGMGMYEYISDALIKQDRQKVIENLRIGLKSNNQGVVYRCCWWSVDIDAWDLLEDIKPLQFNENTDIQEAATAFIKLREENA